MRQYLLLGSASPALLRQAGESLLGRVETIEVGGFDLREVRGAAAGYSAGTAARLWLRGGYPRSYLAGSDANSVAWRHAAIASREGFALEQVLRLAKPEEVYFRATHQGAELGLPMLRGSQRVGVEFKRADAPHVTRSMQIAMQDLKIDALYVVYPGERRFNLGPGIEAVPLWAVLPPA